MARLEVPHQYDPDKPLSEGHLGLHERRVDAFNLLVRGILLETLR
jgi:hypothetical protein